MSELQRWKKIGGGSLRLKKQIIKSGQVFCAFEEEIPEAFKKFIVPITEPISAQQIEKNNYCSILSTEKNDLYSMLPTPEVTYILGGGPSLKKVDLSLLKGQFVIAVNRAYEIYPNANLLFFADSSFFEEHQEGIRNSPIPYKVTIANIKENVPGLYRLPRVRQQNTNTLAEKGGLIGNTNSGLMAANLAFQLGTKLVVLLGMDMKEIKGAKHWHDGYKHPSPPKTCDQMLAHWKGIRSCAWQMFGGDFLHGTPGSALKEIQYVPLPEILKSTQTMLYFGGWWLPKTEQHFRSMLKSSKEYKGRLTYQTYNKLFPALDFLSPGKRDGIAIDVGSNLGFWAYPLSNVFSEVHCFEPSPLHCQCWKLNMKGKKNVKLYPFGIAEEVTELLFSSPPTSCGGTHVGSEIGENVFTAPVRPLDSFPQLTNVSFMKVDCEGYELPVLRSAEKLLRREKPLVVVEQKTEWEGRYTFPPKGAVHFLESLGARVLKEIYGDYIMGWE